jgi:hypothetical protein
MFSLLSSEFAGRNTIPLLCVLAMVLVLLVRVLTTMIAVGAARYVWTASTPSSSHSSIGFAVSRGIFSQRFTS